MIPSRSLVLALLAPQILTALAAFERSWLWGVLALDLVVLLAAGLDAWAARRPVVGVRRNCPDLASLDRSFEVELVVESRCGRRLALQVMDELPLALEQEGLPAELQLAEFGAATLRYRVRAHRRGPARFGAVTVRYPSPSGLWKRQLRLEASHELRVYPDVEAVRHWELLARLDERSGGSRATRVRGGDTEFERLRDHRPDDEIRHIDWRATARRRQLTVKEFQVEQNQRMMILLDSGRTMMAEFEGKSAFDHALNAVLMLGHVASRRGDQVGLVAFGDGVTRHVPFRSGQGASNRLIQATYDLFPDPVEPDYDAAIRTLHSRVRARSLVVLLTHALDGPTADRLRRLPSELLPRHLPLIVLLRDADVQNRLFSRATSAEELGAQAVAAELSRERERLILDLQRSGCLVLDVLHRDLTPQLMSRYLEIKAGGLL